MAAFKDVFDLGAAREFAERVAGVDADAFVAAVEPTLETLELKDRVDLLAETLNRFLPGDFPAAVDTIVDALPPAHEGTEGVSDAMTLWPFCRYVGRYGVHDFEASFAAMYELTRRFSCEFAIRPFLVEYPEKSLERLTTWAQDDDVHVRRLVSEGTRPRLPWGMRLNQFVDDPSPILLLLDMLKDDPEEYVRRSVANNLNDIAKDHPELVVQIAKRWWSDDVNRQRLVKRGLRTLIKRGDPGALEVLGYGPPIIDFDSLKVGQTVAIGDELGIELTVTSAADREQDLLIDYVIHHVKANGSRTPKVFKWTTRTLGSKKSLTLEKDHSMKRVTTRKYYPGEHLVEVLINGVVYGPQVFELTDPS